MTCSVIEVYNLVLYLWTYNNLCKVTFSLIKDRLIDDIIKAVETYRR